MRSELVFRQEVSDSRSRRVNMFNLKISITEGMELLDDVRSGFLRFIGYKTEWNIGGN